MSFHITPIKNWLKLLRWDKPSGRLILLIPAGWSLWLAPSSPPSSSLFFLIILGGICISGAGCIANDLWDKKIDKEVARTKFRPLATGSVRTTTAGFLLLITLALGLLAVLMLPISSRNLCLQISSAALIPILIYPSSKRWFKYPQALLALCWGFAVLIPWAASESSIEPGWGLITCWIATMSWTFGFDTVYAMPDMEDDKELGLNSSALNLGENAKKVVSISYLLTSLLLGISAFLAKVSLIFWPLWIISSFGMQREVLFLKNQNQVFKNHFKNQVLLGSLVLLGLILARA